MNNLAYLAGLIDGEGCIRICKRKAYGKYKNIRYTLYIDLQMSEKKTIEYVAKHFNISFNQIKPVGNQRRIPYRISWHANKAKEILKSLLPYLQGKKEQAKMGIEFQDKIIKPSHFRHILLTPKDIAIREFYYHQLRLLKTQV